ncbi:hypothetical protein AHAS_Ahas11G0175400 [Arachis hypogaea]
MRVFGSRWLVSMVVQSYVEEGIHRHMVGLVGNHKGVHRNHCLGMNHRMVIAHSALEGVIAERVDQILVALTIFDCPNLDACSHYSFHSLQHNLNQTRSQRGENS